MWELPKSDTETRGEQMLLEKWHQYTCLTRGCHDPSIVKNLISMKGNKAKCSKMRYTCTALRGEWSIKGFILKRLLKYQAKTDFADPI